MPRAKSKHAHEVKPTKGKLDSVNTDTEISVGKRKKRDYRRAAKLIELAKMGHSAPDIAAALGMPKKQVYNSLAYHGIKAGKARGKKPFAFGATEQKLSEKPLKKNLTTKEILKMVERGIPASIIAEGYGIKKQRIYNAINYRKEQLARERKLAQKPKAFKESGISVTVSLSKKQINSVVAQAAAQATKLIDIDILVDKAVREWARRMVHTANA